jgi:hypothetical protein
MKRDDDLRDRISSKWNERAEPDEAEEVEEIEEVKRPGRRSSDEEDATSRSFRRRLPARDDDEDEEEKRPRRKKKKRKSNVGKVVVLSILGLAVFLGCVILLLVLLKPRDRIGPFKDQMAGYLSDPVKGNAPPNTAVKGKMIAVSDQVKGLDDVYFSLSPRVKADAPEEVKTVVRVNKGENKVGQYTNGAPGYRYRYSVQVIDWMTKQVVASRDFEGSMPPTTIHTKSSSPVYGSDPKGEVVSYLNGLPK